MPLFSMHAYIHKYIQTFIVWVGIFFVTDGAKTAAERMSLILFDIHTGKAP